MSMEMLFATVGGAIFGIGAHYAIPHRVLRGAALLCSVGAVVAAVVWAGLTWLGWPFDGTWIWVVSLVASGLVPALVGVLLNRTRSAGDERMLDRLSRA